MSLRAGRPFRILLRLIRRRDERGEGEGGGAFPTLTSQADHSEKHKYVRETSKKTTGTKSEERGREEERGGKEEKKGEEKKGRER